MDAEEEAGSLRALSAEDIAGVDDAAVEKVDVPEWSGSIFIRAMTALERLQLHDELATLPPGEQYLGLFVILAYCLAQPDGSRMFADVASARKALEKRRSLIVLNRLQDAALVVNDLKGDAAKKGSRAAEDGSSPTA